MQVCCYTLAELPSCNSHLEPTRRFARRNSQPCQRLRLAIPSDLNQKRPRPIFRELIFYFVNYFTMLKVLPQDYVRYIAKFMHPIELELATVLATDNMAKAINLKWHAGVEFILQNAHPISLDDIFQLTKFAPELMLKYPYWRNLMRYNDDHTHGFIIAITATHELKFQDWEKLCSLDRFQDSVMCGATRSGNTQLMGQIFKDSFNRKELLSTYSAIEYNQPAAVKKLLSWGSDLYAAWWYSVRFGRLEIIKQLPKLTEAGHIKSLISHGIWYNQLNVVTFMNSDDEMLIETCKAALQYQCFSVVHRVWNQHIDLRDTIRLLVADCDLQYLLF